MAGDVSLVQSLASLLPSAVRVRVLHVSTRPCLVDALFAPAPGQQEEKTYCESHLVSIASVPSDTLKDTLLLFAIEILIFTTRSQTTLFISKADSTGYLHLLNRPKSVPSVVKIITTTVIQQLLGPRLNDPSVVLSLFARAQNQYLFPGSSDYRGKHVLDDRQLIKWWCQILDAVGRDKRSVRNKYQNTDGIQAYLMIPGLDRGETRSFFPSSARFDAPERLTWISSYPVSSLAPTTKAALRCLIPRLPDDPKARFLTDLDDDIDKNGEWKSVKSLDQFWEMMSFRQECAAGRLVGFMWLTFPRQSSQVAEKGVTERDTNKGTSVLGKMRSLPTPGASFVDGNPPVTRTDIPAKQDEAAGIRVAVSPPASSPILSPTDNDDHIEHTPEELGTSAGELYYDDLASHPVRWPQETRGQIVIDEDRYQELVEHLLQLDFSTQTLCADASREFIEKGLQLSQADSWGQDVMGRKEMPQISSRVQDAVTPRVNVLTAVRKKRKAETVDGDANTPAATEPAVTVLASALIRKKLRE